MVETSLSAALGAHLRESDWRMAESLAIPGREKQFVSPADLVLHPSTRMYLSTRFPEGLYLHQYEATKHLLNGENTCLLSGTASGKSLAFYVAGLETLARIPKSKVLAFYPLKALGREQETRWVEALGAAGFDGNLVGRVDGNVPVANRQQILREARVIIATPDVVHAWLFSNLSDRAVLSFLRGITEIIVDEVHSYSGVFGSNAAYLFRRLRHCLTALGVSPRFIAASATVAAPESHLSKLFGVDFSLVPAELDSSPRYELSILMATPPRRTDLLTEVAKLIEYLAVATQSRFIVFVDSRKLSEHLATIVSRAEPSVEDETTDESPPAFDHLSQYSVLPYRAGYEEADRETIQRRLSHGTLRGVVSTSALELGIDIPHLDCGVLVGVPRSSTNLMQRIGRVGRRVPGCVVVVNTGSLHDEAVFRKPGDLLKRPYAEAALYLENRRIQYMHALCLARHGGEHDQICESLGLPTGQTLPVHVNWPHGFVELAEKERLGEVEPGLQSMKSEAGENPNYAFPLRDVESQYQVELRSGPESRQLGSLSYGQVMREAYPGAVYYYTTVPHRVSRIELTSKKIFVRRTKRYFTSPNSLPTLVFPNLSESNVFTANEFPGMFRLIECNVQIRESLSGFTERRGQNKVSYSYPISPIDSAKSGVTFRQSRFSRNFFTTGIVLSHPLLTGDTSVLTRTAELLYEAFLSLVPFERQDVNFAVDRHRADRPPYAQEGEGFIAIYDQTYGSLRLTARLTEHTVLQRVLENASQVSTVPELESDPRVTEILMALADSAKGEPTILSAIGPGLVASDRYASVLLPGTTGLVLSKGNQEARIARVFVHPTFGLCYKVEYDGMLPGNEHDVILPVGNVGEIPGESKLGWYDYQNGDVLESAPSGQ